MTQINLMALRHSAFYSPYLMTMAGGYLKRAGLEATYQVQTADMQVKDRLLNGQCHVSQSAVAAGFADLQAGEKNSIRHFAQINSRDGFFIAARNQQNLFNWQHLQGSDVLVDHFFQPLAMFKFALHKQNIEWDSLNVIDAGSVEEIDLAFRMGKGDYVHQQGPAPQQMQADGIATVVASVGEAIGPVAFSSLCATEEWLATEMATTFLRIYKESLKECQQNSPADITRQLQLHGFLTEIDSLVLSQTIRNYQALGCWQHDGSIGQQEYETLLDVFEFSRLINQRFTYDSLIKSL